MGNRLLYCENITYCMVNEDRREEIREQKREELRKQYENAAKEKQQSAREQQEREKDAFLRKVLTDDARKRLKNASLAHEELAESVEMNIYALYKKEAIDESTEISEEQVREMLLELKPDNSFDVKRR